ncbi:MAG: hypothetical protein NVS9B2_01600 [Steroidobacteraceae bacterium]
MRASFDPAAVEARKRRAWLGLAALAAALNAAPVLAQDAGTTQKTPTQKAAKTARATPPKPAGNATRYLPNRFAGRAGEYYKLVWGVDSLSVKLVESGEIIRFTWRVLDAERAKALSNKASQPSLIDPQAGVSLVVPTMENVGMLRQTATPEQGKSYWMAFSNKGRHVKRGDRVNVLIGQFRAEGLAVD